MLLLIGLRIAFFTITVCDIFQKKTACKGSGKCQLIFANLFSKFILTNNCIQCCEQSIICTIVNILQYLLQCAIKFYLTFKDKK